MSLVQRRDYTCTACHGPFSAFISKSLLCPECKAEADRARRAAARTVRKYAERVCTLTKSPDVPDGVTGTMKQQFEIAKFSEDEQLVFGYANVAVAKSGASLVDLQGDIIDPAELERAAYQFMADFGTSGEMHQGGVRGRIVESVVFTPQKLSVMGLTGEVTKSLTPRWWIGVKLDTETFQKVKAGTLKMFSIQGQAERIPVEIEHADETA